MFLHILYNNYVENKSCSIPNLIFSMIEFLHDAIAYNRLQQFKITYV